MTREELGLPDDWRVVEKWAKKSFDFGLPIPNRKEKKVTPYDGMNFRQDFPKEFWEKFPSRPMPKRPETRVRVKRLKRMVKRAKKEWTIHEKKDAERAVKFLSLGGPSYQNKILPGMKLKNAVSVLKHGAEFTETLEKWIREGFVAGPFEKEPLEDFRTNCIIAIEQSDKIRPVVNMSGPKDCSFNSNVDKAAIPRVRMSSAAQFGQTLLKAGKGAVISKLDMKDAFKLVPARTEDLRLQGFSWGGATFVETQMTFGGSPSVSNFDTVAKTVQQLAMESSKTDRKWTHRTLDDMVVVSPAGSGICEKFTEDFAAICDDLNIKLADDCKKCEKAFKNKTRGTILGIRFDSEKGKWSISQEKASKILSDIHQLIHGGHTDLKQMEILSGRLNNFGQMCPFLQAFRRPMNDLLASFKEDYNILLPVTDELKEDLRVWAAATVSATAWMPICKELEHPPLDALKFISDAAGGTGKEGWAGVASVGTKSNGEIWFSCTGRWPDIIFTGSDEKGAKMASKMTMLETIGIMLPLLTIPLIVRGRNIILGVDNISVHYAWENKTAKGDLLATVLVRALHILSSFLACRIFVEHVPRRSCSASILADNLTRESTTTKEVLDQIRGAHQFERPHVLWEWLKNPAVDWRLGFTLVDWLKNSGRLNRDT